MGRRSLGVRHGRGAARRPRQAHRRASSGCRPAWRCATGASRRWSSWSTRTRRSRWSTPRSSAALHDLAHRLEAQGATIAQYLEATGQTEEQLVDGAASGRRRRRSRPIWPCGRSPTPRSIEADRRGHRRRDRPDGRVASRSKAGRASRQLERADQMPAVRSDWKKSKALEWLVDHVEIVDTEGHPIDRALLEPDKPDADASRRARPPSGERSRRPKKRDQPCRPVPRPRGLRDRPTGASKSYDLFSRMLEENIVFLGTPIDDYVANAVCAQMLYLEYKNADKDISLYINSPGRRHHRPVRHLRHDEVRQERHLDVLLRPGRLGGGGAPGRAVRRASATPCRTPAS